MEIHSNWREILDYAIWAPSPHNVQPWKIKILSETEAELFYDPNRLLPVEDARNRFLLCGFGIFLETMSIAANHSGYETKFEPTNLSLSAKGNNAESIGKLTLIKTDRKDTLDRELIKKRRTSRLPYSSILVPEEVQRELQSVAKQFEHNLTFSTEPSLVKWVIELNKNTMFYDMEEDDTRKEIGSWMRYSFKQAATNKDGLWTVCMNVSSWLMKIFFDAQWIINLPIIKQVVQKYYIHSTSTPTIAWLQGPFSNNEEWLNSGHMLARLWLTLTKHDLYLHPFGSIITNSKSHQELVEKFNLDETKELTWLIMRVGYSSEPPRSMRLSVNDILI